MNTLTQEQKQDLAREAGCGDWAGYSSTGSFSKTLDAAFALGVAQGIQQERDRINYRAAVFANAPHNVTV